MAYKDENLIGSYESAAGRSAIASINVDWSKFHIGDLVHIVAKLGWANEVGMIRWNTDLIDVEETWTGNSIELYPWKAGVVPRLYINVKNNTLEWEYRPISYLELSLYRTPYDCGLDLIPSACGTHPRYFMVDNCLDKILPYGKFNNAMHLPTKEVPTDKAIYLFEDGHMYFNLSTDSVDEYVNVHGNVVEKWDAYDPCSNPYSTEFVVGQCYRSGWSMNCIESIPTNEIPWIFRDDISRVYFAEPITPTNMNFWFAGLNNLRWVDSENLSTSNVESMCATFYACKSNYVGYMVWDLSNLKYADSMFENCSNLPWVDLRYSFKKGCHIDSCQQMFYGCSELETIYACTTVRAARSAYMFGDCTKLIGMNGETYDRNKVDASMASVPGYFTCRFNEEV